jgi:hypothetical protein
MPRRTNNTAKRSSAPRQRAAVMVNIKFLDKESEALGFLMTEFYGTAFRSGEVIVPPEALAALAAENYRFTVLGRATHDQMATFRSHVSTPVQRRQNRSAEMAG